MSNLQDVLQQIDNLLKELNSLPPIAEKDEVRLWQKFRLEWNYNSNHIEGNTLTYGETMLLLIKGKTTGDHDIREYDEMKAHDVAVDVVKNWATSEVRPFNSGDICDLNRTLLVRPFWKEAITPTGEPTQKQIIPGQYKTTPNHVKLPNGEIFRYAEPEDVQREMQELIDWYRDEAADLHPLITAAMLHYRFVCIHPFDEGNGRVSRLLMNYHLMKNDMPPIIIKSDDKKNYLTALSKADAGDEESFITYVGEQLLWSLDLAINARRGESIEEDKDWKKRITLIKKGNQGKKKSVSKLNTELLIKRFQDSFHPFLSSLEKQFEVHFNDLFSSHQTSFAIGQTVTFLSKDADRINILLKGLPSSIQYSSSWKGFLFDGVNSYNIYSRISILFDEFTYKVYYENQIMIEQLYTTKLSEEIINSLVNSICKNVTKIIENKTKS
jgi:Fic family protein